MAGIGEVLWDVFPEKEIFGGAPANFSIHCSGLGQFLCPRVDWLYSRAEGPGFSPAKRSEYRTSPATLEVPTGIVEVNLDPHGQPSYVIEKHSAWDELLTVEYLNMFPHGIDAVCFGTWHNVIKQPVWRFDLCLVRCLKRACQFSISI